MVITQNYQGVWVAEQYAKDQTLVVRESTSMAEAIDLCAQALAERDAWASYQKALAEKRTKPEHG